MSHRRKTLLAVSTVILIASTGLAPAASDDGFAGFWTEFKTAVGKNDQAAVAQMVRYPIFDTDAQRSAAEFPRVWKRFFKPAQRTCLAKQKPVRDTSAKGQVSYSAFCDDMIYGFGKDGSGWKLTDFSVND